METTGDRIAWLVSEMGLNKSQFGKLLGKHYKQVLGWIQGKPMEAETAVLICRKTGASLDWLLMGVGEAPRPPKIDPATLGGAEVVADVSARLETTGRLPAKLLAFLDRQPVTEPERRALLTLAASDGVVDYADELRRLRVPAHKRTPEAPATKVELPENIGRLPTRKKR